MEIEDKDRLRYINVSTDQMTVAGLSLGLKSLLKELESLLNDNKLGVESVNVMAPYTDDDKVYIELGYYLLYEADVDDREVYLRLANEHLVSLPNEPIVTIQGDITYIRLQNPQKPIEQQGNVLQLFEKCLSILENYDPAIKVLDFTFHSHANDDALYQPYIHLYLQTNPTFS